MKLSNFYPFAILAVSSVFVTGCSSSETSEVTTEATQKNIDQSAKIEQMPF